MKRHAVSLIAVSMLCGALMAAMADPVYYEDMSDIESDWSPVYDPGSSAIYSNMGGGWGSFGVLNNGDTVAYSPNDYLAFGDSATWDARTLSFDSDAIGDATYSVGFDMFDSGQGYLDSTNLLESSTSVGTMEYDLNGLNWAPGTEYVRPKITVTANQDAQDVVMNEMTIQATIPEPASALLIALGLSGGLLIRRAKRRGRL